MKQVLVINSGSSSIKYELFDMTDRTALASGLLERIGEPESRLKHEAYSGSTREKQVFEEPITDHGQGMKLIGRVLAQDERFRDGSRLVGIGHRAVHGGETFTQPTLIDDSVIESIRQLVPLAPLHNPANLTGIEVARAAFPDVPQVAVFDTAFHQTLPRHAYHYAIPRSLYEQFHIRRYGFHGTSHHYVAKQVATHLGIPLEALNAIVFHLGNGASATAIKEGKSVDTSMGFTPLEGLVMGTRSGDLDPAIVFHVAKMAGKSLKEVDDLLNKESGLKGVCGANDMREVMSLAKAGDDLAQLAVDMFTYRIKKYLGAYFAVLGRVDAIAFTAGIGENSPEIRHQSCDTLEQLGLIIDHQRNSSRERGIREIQSDSSRVKILVVPTDEELEIAEQTFALTSH